MNAPFLHRIDTLDLMVLQPKTILPLVLVASGILVGCSTTSPNTGKKTFDYIKSETSSVDDSVLKGLGHGFSIRAAANSWQELVQKAKPAFAWNGREMMWIEFATNGSPQFRLEEAYLYQPSNQPQRWILVKDKRRSTDREIWQKEDWWRQFSNYNLPAVAQLHNSSQPLGDYGGYGHYAVIKSKRPDYGEVYEIGWERETGIGTAHPTYNRTLYLYRDTGKQWHFLGEGPEEGASREDETSFSTEVFWGKRETAELPLEIRFVSKDTSSVPPSQADDQMRAIDLTTHSELILSPPFPCSLRETTKRPYLVSDKNDTWAKIAEQVGYWQPGWAAPDKKSEVILKKQVLEMLLVELPHLNSSLPTNGYIKEGTHVQLPTYKETEEQMKAMQKPSVK